MPRNQKHNNNQKGGNTQKNKRKANSPICEEAKTTSDKRERVSEHSYSSSKDINNSVLQYYSMNQTDCQSLMNPGYIGQQVTSPIMSYPATPISNAVPFQYAATSPQTPQYLPPPAHQQQMLPGPPGPPTWVKDILDEIKALKPVIPQLETINTTLTSLHEKFKNLETKVTTIEQRVDEVEKACTFISEKHDENTDELKQARTQVKNLEKSCKALEENIKSLKNDNTELKSTVTDLQSRSMRENLLFYGIPEIQTEDCELLVKQFCHDKLGVDASTMAFDRVHRVGGRDVKKPRPIVAKFHYYKERETIRQKGIECNTQLKAENLGVGIQRPKSVRDARKKLYHIMKREQDRGNNARFVGDKLYVNGQLYNDDENNISI